MATTLHDIIEDIYLESQDIDSIFRNKKRYNMVRYGKEGLQELEMTFATHLKAMNVEIPTSCKIYKPNGYEAFVRAYLIDCDGRTIEIKRNPNIPNDVLHYLTNCDGSLITSDCGDIFDTCISCNPVKNPDFCLPYGYNESYERSYFDVNCNICKGTGKFLSKESQYLVNALNKYKNSWITTKDILEYFQFSSDLEGLTIMIEYLSNETFNEDECAIQIETNLSKALTYYIRFRLLENGMETMAQSQYYWKRFKMARDKEIIRFNAMTKFDIYSIFLKK